jgi:tetratricopeptide (TPR) repeat protein
LGQQPSAFAQADAARTLGTELVRSDQTNAAATIETVWANYEAGDLLAAVGKLEDARRAFTAGRELAARFAAKSPADVSLQRALAEGHARLGELLEKAADGPAALAELRDAERILGQLAANAPQDLNLQASVAFVARRMASALTLQRDFPAAITQRRLVVQMSEQFAKREPANKTLQLNHADALCRLGDVLLRADAANRTEAVTFFQQGLDILAKHFPGDTDGPAARLRADLEGLKGAASK